MRKKGQKKKAKLAPKPGIKSRLEAIYQKFPKLPYLDKPTSSILLMTILLYFIFTAYVFLSTPPVELTNTLLEDPINKNTALMLLADEKYSYLFTSPGSSQQVDYHVSKQPYCNGLVVLETSLQQPRELCLSNSGNLQDEGFPMLNSTFGNKSILLFSPWMLAVSDDFSWGYKTTVSAGEVEMSLPVTLGCSGKKELAGRQAYEIKISAQDGAFSTFYIDNEKRILLFADIGNISAKLIEAPFEVNWEN